MLRVASLNLAPRHTAQTKQSAGASSPWLVRKNNQYIGLSSTAALPMHHRYAPSFGKQQADVVFYMVPSSCRQRQELQMSPGLFLALPATEVLLASRLF